MTKAANGQLNFDLNHPAPTDTGPAIVARLGAPKPTPVYDTYWRFAAERQHVFFRRFRGDPPPWTDDTVLRTFKFTNAYRASDRVTQYLIRNVTYRGDLPSSPTEVFFRIMIFKLFNKIETWELLETEFEAVTYADYSFSHYDAALARMLCDGGTIYSAAYIMPPGSRAFGHPSKHQNHLRLLEAMMADELPQRLVEARSMRAAYELLRAFPTVGDFLAYQFVIDVNYSELTHFSESDFVMPGPGARDGLQKCFADPGALSEVDLIRFIAERQCEEFARLSLNFKSLWGRPLQLVDCQNLFCEVDKYARIKHPEVAGRSGRTRIKQRYGRPKPPIRYWYPPKWNINSAIAADPRRSCHTDVRTIART